MTNLKLIFCVIVCVIELVVLAEIYSRTADSRKVGYIAAGILGVIGVLFCLALSKLCYD